MPHPSIVFILKLVLLLSTSDSGTGTSWNTLSEAEKESMQTGRSMLVYVHAPWCGPCLKMEKEVFPEVEPLLNRFALAGLDYDDHESLVKAFGHYKSPFEWATHFGAEATPAFILLSPDHNVITQVHGFIDSRSFGLLLSYVSTNAYKHASFEHYVASIQQ